MGTYTEFHFNVELRKDTPYEVYRILEYMTGQLGEGGFTLPDIDLFQNKESRWRFMLNTDSYYYPSKTKSTIFKDDQFGCPYLNIKCNFKNYEDEIEKFLAWICPYVVADDAQYLGHIAQPECDPMFIFYEAVPYNCRECSVTLQSFGSGIQRNEDIALNSGAGI